MIRTPQELVQSIEQLYIKSIKSLFKGNFVNIQIFTKTMQTYVPKKYQISEATIQSLAKAITDLFETLDTDNDGMITWQEFYQFYSICCGDRDEQIQQLPNVSYSKNSQVFKYIQKNSDLQSGKTGRIVIDSLIENYNEVADLPGTKILAIQQIQEDFYITTDTGLYQYDNMFLFPKTLFEPSLSLIQVNSRVSKKTHEKQLIQNLKQAERDLEQMSIPVPTFHRKHVNESDQGGRLLQKLTVNPTVNNCKTVVDSCYLYPYNIFAVTTEYPGLFFINTKQQVSDFYEMEATATNILWDSTAEVIYVGHVSGKVSSFKVSFINDTVLQANMDKEKEQQQMLEQNKTFLEKLYGVMSKKGLPPTKENIMKLTKQDLLAIYPELSQLYIQTHNNVEEIKQRKREIQNKIDHIMGIKAEDFELTNLVSDIIFKTEQSVADQTNINMKDIIKQDPQAYLQACTNMALIQGQYKIQKHGKVKLSVQFEPLASSYVTSGTIKCMGLGRGQWEGYVQNQKNLRIVVASSDGSVLVLDEQFREIASFPNLHPDGIINLHVCDDFITTVGYTDVYLIDSEAVASAHSGYIIVKDNDRATMMDLQEEELIEGNLVKAYTQIKLLQPPRPGTPIMHSFLMGNVLGIIDHQNILTLAYAFTGANITRTSCNLPNLQLSRFGKSSYNYVKDVGYLPVGKMVFYVRAEPNEDTEEDNNIMDVLQLQDNGDGAEYQENVPIGTANRRMLGCCLNQMQDEFAIVTGDLEITVYSLKNGRPARVVNLETYQDDYAINYKQNDYGAIESNDLNQYYAMSRLRVSKAPRTPRSKSLPARRLKQPLQILQTRNKIYNSVLDMLGNSIFGITTNSKGTILYIYGEIGTLTLYWESGKLFDMNNVNIIGQKDINLPEGGAIKNPFDVKVSVLEKKKVANNNQLKEGDLSTFSLNVNFEELIKAYGVQCTQAAIQQRQFMICDDKIHNRVFVNDNLQPQKVVQIATEVSKDFYDRQCNTRVLNVFDLEPQPNTLGFVKRFKGKMKDYLQTSQNYRGLQDNLFGLEKIGKFVCEDFFNPERLDKYPARRNFIQRLVHDIISESDDTHFHLTAMDVSPRLGLVAFGGSNGAVYLFDSYTNMLPTGVIQVPFLAQRPGITCLRFCKAYPVLFVGTQDCYVYVYTVRPYQPAGQIVCSFQHGSYHPIDRPANNSAVRRAALLETLVRGVCRIAVWSSSRYTTAQGKLDDVIKSLLFACQGDLKGSHYVRNTHISPFYDEYMAAMRAKNDHGAPRGPGGAPQAQHRPPGQLGTVNRREYLDGGRQLIVGAGQPVVPRPEAVEEHAEQQHSRDYAPEIALVTGFLDSLRPAAGDAATRTTSAASLRSAGRDAKRAQRQRRARWKLAGAVGLLGCFIAVAELGLAEGSRRPVFVLEESQRRAAPPPLPNPARARVNAIRYERGPQASRTDQFLRVQEKKQYKSSKQSAEAHVMRLPDGPDDVSGASGVIYRRLLDRHTLAPVLRPVRVADRNLLRPSATPTAMLFDQDRLRLLVGDECGFITAYDLRELFGAAGLQEVQEQTVQIRTETGTKQIPQGYKPQRLPTRERGPCDLAVEGLLDAKSCVAVSHCYRAHKSVVAQLEDLAGSGCFMSVGSDRRVLCFDVQSGALRGSLQRVQLQRASPAVNRYFRAGVSQDMEQFVIQTPEQLSKRVEAVEQRYSVPPVRLEYPPACQFEWEFRSAVADMDLVRLKDNDMLSVVMETTPKPVEETVRAIVADPAIPVYNQEPERSLLQSTGLTPQRLRKYQDSWTVRAMLDRAYGSKSLQRTHYCYDDVLGSFSMNSGHRPEHSFRRKMKNYLVTDDADKCAIGHSSDEEQA